MHAVHDADSLSPEGVHSRTKQMVSGRAAGVEKKRIQAAVVVDQISKK